MGSKSLVPEPPPRLRVPSARQECVQKWEHRAVRARLSAAFSPRHGASSHSAFSRSLCPSPDLHLARALHSLFRVISPRSFSTNWEC